MIHYVRRGIGPTLVLQHGFLGGSGYWAPQFEAFASSFDIIAPDLPGFAGSSGEPAASAIREHARAVVELLDHLGIERFHLVGHSMGGMVALQLALDWSHRVDRLVLYGTASTGELPERFESFEESSVRIEQLGVEACAERIVATWLVDGKASPAYPLCVESGRGTGKRAAIAGLVAMREWGVAGRLDELRMPVLIICGDRDRSVALTHALQLHGSIPQSQLCVVPGCAHAVHIDAADVFSRVVRRFLTVECQ